MNVLCPQKWCSTSKSAVFGSSSDSTTPLIPKVTGGETANLGTGLDSYCDTDPLGMFTLFM